MYLWDIFRESILVIKISTKVDIIYMTTLYIHNIYITKMSIY